MSRVVVTNLLLHTLIQSNGKTTITIVGYTTLKRIVIKFIFCRISKLSRLSMINIKVMIMDLWMRYIVLHTLAISNCIGYSTMYSVVGAVGV